MLPKHIPGVPRTLTTFSCRKFVHIQFLGYVGYVTEVCWNFLGVQASWFSFQYPYGLLRTGNQQSLNVVMQQKAIIISLLHQYMCHKTIAGKTKQSVILKLLFFFCIEFQQHVFLTLIGLIFCCFVNMYVNIYMFFFACCFFSLDGVKPSRAKWMITMIRRNDSSIVQEVSQIDF